MQNRDTCCSWCLWQKSTNWEVSGEDQSTSDSPLAIHTPEPEYDDLKYPTTARHPNCGKQCLLDAPLRQTPWWRCCEVRALLWYLNRVTAWVVAKTPKRIAGSRHCKSRAIRFLYWYLYREHTGKVLRRFLSFISKTLCILSSRISQPILKNYCRGPGRSANTKTRTPLKAGGLSVNFLPFFPTHLLLSLFTQYRKNSQSLKLIKYSFSFLFFFLRPVFLNLLFSVGALSYLWLWEMLPQKNTCLRSVPWDAYKLSEMFFGQRAQARNIKPNR